MSRLFYPILLTVTAALAVTLWTRHGFSTQWLAALDAAVAHAQSPPNAQLSSGAVTGASGSPAPSRRDGPPPWNGATNGPATPARRLPPTAQSVAGPPAGAVSRARQAPYTQLHLDTPGGLQITQPIPVTSAKVVGRVGNEIVLAADVLPQVNEEFEQMARQYPRDQHAMLFQSLMVKYVKQLVQFKLVVRAAKEEIPDDKFPEMKKTILSHFDRVALPTLLKQWKVKTSSELDAKLKEHGSSLAREKDKFIDQALVSEWMRKSIKFDEHVSHEELLKYYHQHLTDYAFKAKVRFEEIRISYGKKRNRQDAWTAICKLAERAYAGQPIAELAKAHSESLKAEDGGLHDWTNQGSLSCSEIDDALFRLPVGALSNIIEDQKTHAFVVVRVVERASAGVSSFQDAQGGIRDKIRDQRKQAAHHKTLADFMEKNKFRAWTIYDDMLREMEEKAKVAAKKAPPIANRIR